MTLVSGKTNADFKRFFLSKKEEDKSVLPQHRIVNVLFVI